MLEGKEAVGCCSQHAQEAFDTAHLSAACRKSTCDGGYHGAAYCMPKKRLTESMAVPCFFSSSSLGNTVMSTALYQSLGADLSCGDKATSNGQLAAMNESVRSSIAYTSFSDLTMRTSVLFQCRVQQNRACRKRWLPHTRKPYKCFVT